MKHSEIPKHDAVHQATHWYWFNSANQRYYDAHLVHDLFGDWHLLLAWGRRGTRLGGLRYEACSTPQSGYDIVQRIHRRRLQHGYVLLLSTKA